MSQTVTDCSAGTWYSFNNTNLNIGQTVQVQFGAFDEGKTALNIYLTRPGGSLVQSLVLNAGFNRNSNVYRLYNSSSTCELEQLNLTIPNDAGVATNDVQTFQFGIFNASVPLSQNGIALSGFLAWSPDFQVWNNVTTTTSAAPTTSTTSITSTTATAAPSATTTPASNNNSSGGLSSGAKAGIGIGAALGGVLLAVLIVGAWLWNRRKQRGAAAGQPDAPPMESFTKPPGPESDARGQGFAANTQNQGLHELPPAVNSQTDEKGYYQSVPQQPAVHEMPSNHQAYEMA
ncbi:hypothetical protein TMatcc_006439 [Talaromyces marneffei ATCC 18224]|uniref:Uncharacterized protein n=1 Tax=Talaromyces marneffei (strain ATCC 18224 / CBS 334.59 / QM 7333) TaxID=441960 RepID=B6QAS8_TALMQ|nr:uncharacterized protein EYB26_002623 [Talaromyces marneffei]EEA25336.1 conserved hypothetical protein [Talaromyces marneffei ATCC 18224]QGA14967.1 hypothetical protein EYB26_002623 [Talaromyces marneffei]